MLTQYLGLCTCRMETETRAGFLLVFELTRLLGLVETAATDEYEEERNLIRLLTPICKLYTAKQVFLVMGIQVFGLEKPPSAYNKPAEILN